MPASVIEEMGGFGGVIASIDSRGHGELKPRTFIFELNPVGENILDHPGIPAAFSSITIGVRTFRCDSRGVERLSDTGGRVTCLYSTDGRFRFAEQQRDRDQPNFRGFSMTTRIDPIKVPEFIAGEYEYTVAPGQTAGALWWYPEPFERDREWDVLQIEVLVPIVTSADIIATILAAKAQSGHMHTFPAMPNLRWVMRPPSFVHESDTRLAITYTWEADSGTFASDNPAPVTNPPQPGQMVTAPWRGGFESYRVTPGRPGIPPVITIRDLFPPTVGGVPNPYYDLEGWRDLPGTPI